MQSRRSSSGSRVHRQPEAHSPTDAALDRLVQEPEYSAKTGCLPTPDAGDVGIIIERLPHDGSQSNHGAHQFPDGFPIFRSKKLPQTLIGACLVAAAGCR